MTDLDDALDSALIEMALEENGDKPMMPSNLLRQNLKGEISTATAWRKACGLTQKELSEKTGLRIATISDFERTGNARVSTLRAIASALNLEPGDLL